MMIELEQSFYDRTGRKMISHLEDIKRPNFMFSVQFTNLTKHRYELCIGNFEENLDLPRIYLAV